MSGDGSYRELQGYNDERGYIAELFADDETLEEFYAWLCARGIKADWDAELSFDHQGVPTYTNFSVRSGRIVDNALAVLLKLTWGGSL